MTTREKLHRLVDDLSDEEVGKALRLLSSTHQNGDPLVALMDAAPIDDEPFTDEDAAAIAEVEADRAAGVPTIPFEEIKREFGYTPD
jgi:hypothetical protein